MRKSFKTLLFIFISLLVVGSFVSCDLFGSSSPKKTSKTVVARIIAQYNSETKAATKTAVRDLTSTVVASDDFSLLYKETGGAENITSLEFVSVTNIKGHFSWAFGG